MYDMPIIRFELSGIRQQVGSLFAAKHQELSNLISTTLEEELNEHWVRIEVRKAVVNCIQKAINDMVNNRDLQQHLTNCIVEQLTNKK